MTTSQFMNIKMRNDTGNSGFGINSESIIYNMYVAVYMRDHSIYSRAEFK